ncbi:2TM domain-containing protein [Spongiivirga sp. MCCC 1A20706]|uniref:2TM domain-containing protein n=1 Tax=Spongiivirga sp. MCCC 1A20706 TaxID=3160963 RepID=UPI0039779A06
MENFKNENKYIRAKERVEQLKKFYGKLGTYLVIIAMLAAINYYTNEFRNAWFLWVAGFWGLGIIIDAGKTFGISLLFGRNWEERKIRELMNEDDKKEDRPRTEVSRKEAGKNWWE